MIGNNVGSLIIGHGVLAGLSFSTEELKRFVTGSFADMVT